MLTIVIVIIICICIIGYLFTTEILKLCENSNSYKSSKLIACHFNKDKKVLMNKWKRLYEDLSHHFTSYDLIFRYCHVPFYKNLQSLLNACVYKVRKYTKKSSILVQNVYLFERRYKNGGGTLIFKVSPYVLSCLCVININSVPTTVSKSVIGGKKEKCEITIGSGELCISKFSKKSNYHITGNKFICLYITTVSTL